MSPRSNETSTVFHYYTIARHKQESQRRILQNHRNRQKNGGQIFIGALFWLSITALPVGSAMLVSETDFEMCSPCPMRCSCNLDPSSNASCVVRCSGVGLHQLPNLDQLPPLDTISSLDLSDNSLSQLTIGELASFTVLRHLNLANNDWKCDCFLRLLVCGLLRRNVTLENIAETICKQPAHLRGQMITPIVKSNTSLCGAVCISVEYLMSSNMMSDTVTVATSVPVDFKTKLLAVVDQADGSLESLDVQVVCRWNFNDGSSTPIKIPIKMILGSPFFVSFSHVYKLPGSYQVTLDVTIDDSHVTSVGSVNVTVIDRIRGLFVGNNGPTLLRQPTFIEVHRSSGTNVQFNYEVVNDSSVRASGEFDLFNDDGTIRGVRLAFAFTKVGRHIVKVLAINDVSSFSTFTVVHVINESTLEIVGLASSIEGRRICGLPLNTDIHLVLGVVHWNVSGLLFAWIPSPTETLDGSRFEILSRTRGVGLQQVLVRFTETGVYNLTIKVGDTLRGRDYVRSAVYQLCANETYVVDPSPTTAANEYPQMRIGVAWPTSPHVPFNRKLQFFKLVAFDPVDSVCIACANLVWSFGNESIANGVTITGNAPSFMFRRVGTFVVTARERFTFPPLELSGSTNSEMVRSARLTVVVVPEIESVYVRFVSSLLFEAIVELGQIARFDCVTKPPRLQSEARYTWTFSRVDTASGSSTALAAANDVIVTQVPWIERSFGEAGNWTVSVSVSNHVTSLGNVPSASAVLQVQQRIAGLAIEGCCEAAVPTDVEVKFSATVITGSHVSYDWLLKRLDDCEPKCWNFTKDSMIGPTLVNIYKDPGRYRVGLRAQNDVCVASIADEFIVQEPVRYVKFRVQTCPIFTNQSAVFTVFYRIGGTDVRYNWSVIYNGLGSQNSVITSYRIVSSSIDNMIVIFSSPGLFEVTYTAYNDVSKSVDTRILDVTDVECESPEVRLIGSPIRVERSSRKMRFETFTPMICKLYTLVHKWTVFEGSCSRVMPAEAARYDDLVEVPLPSHVADDTPALLIPMGTLNNGQYCLHFRSGYRCAPGSGSVTIDLNVTSSPFKALISGGDERLVTTGDDVIVDGSLSYDPDVARSSVTSLSYRWSCQFKNGDCTNLLIGSNLSVALIPKRTLWANCVYYIQLIVDSTYKPGHSTIQKIIAKSSAVLAVSVDCISCRDNNFFNVSSSQAAKLIGGCGGCRPNDVFFSWTIESIGSKPNDENDFIPIDFNTTTTGNGKSNLVVRSQVFDQRFAYRFHLNVTSKKTHAAGYAFIELGPTPSEPSGGHCKLKITGDTDDNYTTITTFVNQVSISCSNWTDNSGVESPLEYHVFITDIGSQVAPRSWYPMYSGTQSNFTFFLSPFSGQEGEVLINMEVVDSLGSKTVQENRTILVRSLPSPRLDYLLNLVNNMLSDILMTSNPRVVQQYIITTLLQLNVESDEALKSKNDTSLSIRTELRGSLLTTIATVLPISDLQDVQQIAFALKTLTTFIAEFPHNQSMYDHVYDLLDAMIEICMYYVSQGHQADQFMPENLLDAAGNLVDIISSDLNDVTTAGNLSSTSDEILARRQTIKDTIRLIDKTMVLILSTMVSGEESLTYDTGYLHMWGSRVTGVTVLKCYDNGRGSSVHFPVERISETYGNIDLFQFGSTLAINPYSWGFYDGRVITSEVIRAEFTFVNGTELTLTDLNLAKNAVVVELLHSSGLDDEPGGDLLVDYTLPVYDDDRRAFHYSTSVNTSSPKENITLVPNQRLYTFVNLSMVSDDVRAMIITIEAGSLYPDDNDTNDVDLTFYIASDYVPHPYQSDLNYSLHLEWNPSNSRYEVNASIFLSKKESNITTGEFYLTISNDASLSPIQVDLVMFSIQCKHFIESRNIWSTEGCFVNSSTIEKTTCICDHFADFGVSTAHLAVPFSFSPVLPPLHSLNPIVVTVTCLLTVMCIVAMLLAHHMDVLEYHRLSTIPLCGLDGPFRYQLVIFTGKRFGSGTTANVSIQLFGVQNQEDGTGGPGVVSSGSRLLSRPGAFKRAGIDSFVIATDRPLGEINKVHLWHDNSGSKPSWYLAGLIVRDLQSNECRHFLAGRWLTLTCIEDGSSDIEAVLLNPDQEHGSPPPSYWSKVSREISQRLNYDHLLISVFDSTPGSSCCRSRRVLCSALLFHSALALNALWYKFGVALTEYEYWMGTRVFVPSDWLVALAVSLIVFVLTSFIFQLFRLCKQKHLTTKAGARRQSTETVEMDASSSVISGYSESSRPIKCRRRVLDVADILDVNCDVMSIDSYLFEAPRHLHRTDAVKPSTDLNISDRLIQSTFIYSVSPVRDNLPEFTDLSNDQLYHVPSVESISLQEQQQTSGIDIREWISASMGRELSVSTLPDSGAGSSETCTDDVTIDIPWHPSETMCQSTSVLRHNEYLTVINPVPVSQCRYTHPSNCFQSSKCADRLLMAVCVIFSLGFMITSLVAGHTLSIDLSLRWIVVSIASVIMATVFDGIKVVVVALIHSASVKSIDMIALLPFYPSYLQVNEQFTNARAAKPLRGFALLRAREEGRKLAMLKRMFRDSVFYVCFILVVYVINYLLFTGLTGYQLTSDISRRYLTTSFNSNSNFSTIESSDEFWQWVTDVALVNIYSANEQQTVLVGPARLRQLRSQPVSCNIPSRLMPSDDGLCFGDPNWSEDTANYGIGWNPLDLSDERFDSNDTSYAWNYLSDKSQYSPMYFGEVDWYGGRGYTAELNQRDSNESMTVVSNLMSDGWLDRRTRIVLLELTLYNVVFKLYSTATFAVEFDLSGGVSTSESIGVFYLANTSDNIWSLVFFESLLTLLSIYLVVNIVIDVTRLRHRYFTEIWNYVELLVIILVVVSFSLFMAFIARDDVRLVRAANADGASGYVNLTESAILQDVWRCINAVILLLLSFIAVRQLRFVRAMAVFSHTLRITLPILCCTFIVLCVTTVGYSMLGMLWYGRKILEYRSLNYAIITQFIFIRRQTSFLDSVIDQSGGMMAFSVLFTVTYLSVILLVVYCSLVVSLSYSYNIVRRQVYRYSATESRDYKMIDFMVSQFKKCIGITKPKPSCRTVHFENNISASSRTSSIVSSEVVNQAMTESKSENTRQSPRLEVRKKSISQSSLSLSSGTSLRTDGIEANNSDLVPSTDRQQTVDIEAENNVPPDHHNSRSSSRRSSMSSSITYDIEYGDDTMSLWSTVDDTDHHDDVMMSWSNEVASIWNRLFFMLRKIEEHDHEIDKHLWLISNRCHTTRRSSTARTSSSR